jgi:hypothetical protein
LRFRLAIQWCRWIGLEGRRHDGLHHVLAYAIDQASAFRRRLQYVDSFMQRNLANSEQQRAGLRRVPDATKAQPKPFVTISMPV